MESFFLRIYCNENNMVILLTHYYEPEVPYLISSNSTSKIRTEPGSIGLPGGGLLP